MTHKGGHVVHTCQDQDHRGTHTYAWCWLLAHVVCIYFCFLAGAHGTAHQDSPSRPCGTSRCRAGPRAPLLFPFTRPHVGPASRTAWWGRFAQHRQHSVHGAAQLEFGLVEARAQRRCLLVLQMQEHNATACEDAPRQVRHSTLHPRTQRERSQDTNQQARFQAPAETNRCRNKETMDISQDVGTQLQACSAIKGTAAWTRIGRKRSALAIVLAGQGDYRDLLTHSMAGRHSSFAF